MNRPAWRTVLVTVAAVTVLAPALAGDTGALRVQDAWIRAAPPGVSVLAGYMTLVNDADRDAVITSASSPSFRMIEIHRSVSEGGVARMVEQDTLTVPARGRLVLEPNGLHLMLMMPAAPLRPGGAVELSLQLADGRSLGITARVRTPGEP